MEVTWDVQQMFTNRHRGAFEKKDVASNPRDYRVKTSCGCVVIRYLGKPGGSTFKTEHPPIL